VVLEEAIGVLPESFIFPHPHFGKVVTVAKVIISCSVVHH
jgi:hypothetical protein